VARKLDKADREALSHCGVYLTRLEQYAYASEVYMKMGDVQSLITLHVKAKTWEEVCQCHIGCVLFPGSYRSDQSEQNFAVVFHRSDQSDQNARRSFSLITSLRLI